MLGNQGVMSKQTEAGDLGSSHLRGSQFPAESQESPNAPGQISPWPVFVNKVLLEETVTYYVLPLVAFELQ